MDVEETGDTDDAIKNFGDVATTSIVTKENEINALTDKASVIAFNISL